LFRIFLLKICIFEIGMRFSGKIQVFLLMVFCLFTRVGGQTIWDPKVYHSVSAEEKTALLLDNFDDNRYNWGLGQAKNNWLEKITDGKLYFQSFDNNAKEDLIKFELPSEHDFEIETSIRFIVGDTARFFGLQWGKSSDFNNQYDFLISGNGLVSIDKFSGEFFDYLPPALSEFLKPGHFNKLTIRKINTNYYFFINEELIHTMPFKPFFGPYFGFQVGENSAIEVDYFKISELTKLNVNTPPDIFITEPQKIENSISVSSAFVTPEKEITLKGTVMDDGGVYDLFINDREVLFNTNGEFTASLPLAPDINLVRIVARDKQLITSEKVLYIERTMTESQGSEKEPFASVNYYALLISVGQYDDPAITDLDQPLSDGARLKNVLVKNYTFPEKNINWLKNPNREDLIVAFDNLGKKLTKDDNLLIFYAGHGYWDNNLMVGYWMPKDSKISNPANWFPNSTIRDYVRGIKARHILLISDACFSGGILKTRNVMANASPGIMSLYNLACRKVMTSGTLTEVPDESVFMKYLLSQLEENKDPYLSSEQLFSKIKVAVLNNSQTVPQFGTMQDTGDEGGDFIFIHK
jgi:hypothetical protein